jgi:branched-chain amino acid transport system permease protein
MTNRRRILLLVLVLLALVVPAIRNIYYTRLATEVAILGMAALSVDLLLGYAGLLTFGQAAFFGIGAYVTGILTVAGVTSAFVVWPAAVLASMVVAAAVGALALRTTGFPFIMVTLAFAQMVFYFFQSLRRYGGENGFTLPVRNSFGGIIDITNHAVFYYVTLALLIGVIFIATRIVNSQFGMVIRGARDNERRLAAMGFPPYPYKLAAFIISGGIAGLAGALIANYTSQVSTGLLSWQESGNFLAMVILGSAGTIIGPVFGAGIFLFFQQWLSDFTDHWMLLFGPLLVLRVIFIREGLWGMLVRVAGAQEASARAIGQLVEKPIGDAIERSGGQ